MASDDAGGGRPLVSIVIPVFNRWDLTWKCLLALSDHTASPRQGGFEVIVVDDGSTDETREALPRLEGVRSHRNPVNSGFAHTCNQGARLARGRYLLFLNNDTEVQRGWLAPMTDILEQRLDVAVVGCKLLFPDRTIQHGGVVFSYGAPTPVMPFHLDYRQPADTRNQILDLNAVTAACMLIRAEVFQQLGGFDEGYRNGLEDVDLCLRVKAAGHKIFYTPHATVTHHESMSDGRFHSGWANEQRFNQTWIGRFEGFEFDYRRGARPPASDPQRPGVSVVVVVQDALSTVAPCLENVRLTLGHQDRLVIFDDGSREATRRYLEYFHQRYPGVATVMRTDARIGFTASSALALPLPDGAGVARPYSALLPANVKVTPGWLDRLVRHLRADDTLGALSPIEGDLYQLAPKDRFGPPERSDPGIVQPPLSRAAEVDDVALPPSLCLAGPTALLAELAHEPDVFFGHQPEALAAALSSRGKRLASAADVVVYRLEDLEVNATQRGLRPRYLAQQVREVAAEQSELLSLVVVSDGEGRDALSQLQLTMASLLEHTRPPFEVVLVDDGGPREVTDYLRRLEIPGHRVTLIHNGKREGLVFSRNQGMAAASGQMLALVDPHLVVSRGWSQRLAAALHLEAGVGAVGPTTNLAPGLQSNPRGAILSLEEVAGFAEQMALESRGELVFGDRLSGSCLLLSRALVDKVGGFDTTFVTLASTERDFCQRARRLGFRLAVSRDVYVHDHRGRPPYNALERRLAEEQDRDLFASRSTDTAEQHLPLAHTKVFHPRVPPIDLGLAPDVTALLVIPDMEGTSWREVVRVYLCCFNPGDKVALVLRMEPPGEVRTQEALTKVTALLSELGFDPQAVPDIVFESTALSAARRGGLYTAAHAYVSCPGPRDHLWRREATACGLHVLEGDDEQLGRLLRAAAWSGGETTSSARAGVGSSAGA